ncbi:hypothetical protein KIV40_25225 [Vibrio sp. D173a]|uniref:hypothetical protein n=1 Tax=Vibrio sp. D173a TaxID=2836349 RepID=UPI00255416D9|nr:hypothetical protein [Vibrio sp. D173a]MDK9758601.1 hypothetical protein [Vibrio sp. D173a]
MIKRCLLPILLFTTSVTNASGIASTKITSLMLDQLYPNQVFIKTSKPHVAGSPDCHSNSTWSYVLRLDNEKAKTMYSMLLAAHMAGKPVSLVGTGSCTSFEIVEDLRRIELSFED